MTYKTNSQLGELLLPRGQEGLQGNDEILFFRAPLRVRSALSVDHLWE